MFGWIKSFTDSLISSVTIAKFIRQSDKLGRYLQISYWDDHNQISRLVFGEYKMNNLPVFDYEDIQLVPNKCIINSRSEADTSVKLG